LWFIHLVERFELIATTGKNAKMQDSPLFNQLLFLPVVEVIKVKEL